ncbi:MAG: histidine kinase [Bacteroidales bacterium]|nr:histidine kinase [Bacteroidales bacterium]
MIDKLTLFFSSFAISHLLFSNTPQVLTFLLALIFISLFSYLHQKTQRRILLGAFALLCIFLPPLTIYLPAVVYDVLSKESVSTLLFLALPLGLFPFLTGWKQFLIFLPVLAISYLLYMKTARIMLHREQNHQLQDHLRETRLVLSELKQAQSVQQENSVRLATLNERNRIARDIHDNVGHLLSSALLQTAALLSGPRAEDIKVPLAKLKETLGEGLDHIRTSVHQLHESPVDLETEIGRLLQSVTNCSCAQTIELFGIPDGVIRQCLLAVTREALSNVIRHSNATQLNLTLKEHPAFYQLVIADNGKVNPAQIGDGMGLLSIKERVSLLGGRIHINNSNGFTLFITLPKEKPT